MKALGKVHGHYRMRGMDGKKIVGESVEVPLSQMIPVPFDKGARSIRFPLFSLHHLKEN